MMDPEFKKETYVSSAQVDSNAAGNLSQQIEHGGFANKDEEELAALGKKQQTRVRGCHPVSWETMTDILAEKLWLYERTWVCVYHDAHLGGDVHVSVCKVNGSHGCCFIILIIRLSPFIALVLFHLLPRFGRVVQKPDLPVHGYPWLKSITGRVFVYGLTNGGPAGLIYGYLFCWFGYFTVVASLAELASM